MPEERGGAPYWDAREFPRGDQNGELKLLASGYNEEDALPIRAQARVYGATIKAGESVTYNLAKGRHAYLGLAKGQFTVNNAVVKARDGAAIKDVDQLTVTAIEDSEIVLVDSK
jgi:VCBS repeat-containing protein